MDFSITLGSDLVGLQSQLQSQDPARQHAQEGQEASSKGTTRAQASQWAQVGA